MRERKKRKCGVPSNKNHDSENESKSTTLSSRTYLKVFVCMNARRCERLRCIVIAYTEMVSWNDYLYWYERYT